MQPSKTVLILLCTFLCVSACGVKGDPVPPQRPAELGRGRPTYRRATERVKVQPQNIPSEEEDEDKEKPEEVE